MSIFRQAALVLADRAEPVEDNRPTYEGEPTFCPFCCEISNSGVGFFWAWRRVASKWHPERGQLLQRCRTCGGQWWVSPRASVHLKARGAR